MLRQHARPLLRSQVACTGKVRHQNIVYLHWNKIIMHLWVIGKKYNQPVFFRHLNSICSNLHIIINKSKNNNIKDI